ncbi:MAG TPA: hypothetical protein VND95_14540 [Stellaceae bacterium]|nr:hypothetical protein [Stellaceae bacterium]
MRRWLNLFVQSGDPSDFLPIVIGCVMLLVSVPGFLAVLFFPDRNSGPLALGLLIVLGIGIMLGITFLIFGIRSSSYPGSLAYRITHGRIFFR